MQYIANNLSFQRDINLQQRVFQWLMLILDEMPKGKQDYDKWIQDGKIITKGTLPVPVDWTIVLMQDLSLQFEISLNNSFQLYSVSNLTLFLSTRPLETTSKTKLLLRKIRKIKRTIIPSKIEIFLTTPTNRLAGRNIISGYICTIFLLSYLLNNDLGFFQRN